MKKILFVTARLPYPANSGRKAVMYNYCKILKEIYGYEVIIASFLEKGDLIDDKPNFIDRVYELDKISNKKKINNLLKYTFIQRNFPMQVSLFWDEKVQKEIDNVIKNENPNIIMCDMVRTTEYLKNYSIYKIADLDDILSIRYKRQAKVHMTHLNPYGAYLYSLPKIIQKFLEISIVKKIMLLNEIKLLEKYERKICECYDKIVFVAENESKLINKELKFNKAVSIPLGVDTEVYSKYYKKLDVEKKSIVFLGAMSVAHNESGVIHFIKNIFPYIIEQIPDVKFYIVGGGVTPKLKSLECENIIFTGYVDDVRLYVGKCRVFVCPLTFGSGIKTKNLEAMAMGVPIVTTTIGAENIHAKNGVDWIVEDNSIQFANEVVRVINENELFYKLQKNANNFVINNFTWRVAEEKFKEALNNNK